MLFAETPTSLSRVPEQLGDLANKLFNWNSVTSFIVFMLMAFIIGRILAWLLRKINKFVSRRADKSDNLPTVERYRRIETIIVISIALIRVLLLAVAIYAWWIYTHPEQQSSALIGASAFFAIVAAGALRPVLSDLASGSMMMTEHWFGVGDHVRIDPFVDMQGIVERVTLRSTRIRGINGEVIWVNNQNISAVRVTQKGSRSIAIELFVSDITAGKELIKQVNLRLPQGPLMMVAPLLTISAEEVAPNMWHLRALGQTAPEREWLLEKYAIEILTELDESLEKPILKSEPIARNADSEAERRFSRSIRNARKTAIKPTLTETLSEQIQDVARFTARPKHKATTASKKAQAKQSVPAQSKKKNRLVQ